ncbi:MAG TPA: RIO1 family regulatory kinase/ATPase [Chloroflexota bacterium]|nr:RIO1 family regulatory kinase/ATPase [Chloroflexota bacterium]
MRQLRIEDEEDLDTDPDDALDADPLDPLHGDGTIVEVLGELKSGKEGTVYACRLNPTTGHEIGVAKVYRSRRDRTFRNDAMYSEGRSFGKARENRAVKNKSRKGREIQQGAWLNHEWETLQRLSSAGADVPSPIARSPNAIVMSFIGEGERPAAALNQAGLGREEVRPAFDRILANVELFLSQHTIHGDLSPFNILYSGARPTIIDFPQSVDPRFNHHALDLLVRDLSNVCAYFTRHGMQVNGERMAHHLWGRYVRSEL